MVKPNQLQQTQGWHRCDKYIKSNRCTIGSNLSQAMVVTAAQNRAGDTINDISTKLTIIARVKKNMKYLIL